MHCVRRFALRCLVLALLVLAAAAPLHARIAFVGPAEDPDCEFHDIQQAIDAWVASADEEHFDLFIANAHAWPTQTLTILPPTASSGITLRGDFAGCRMQGEVGSVVLDGGGANAPVIEIAGLVPEDDGRFRVTLMHLVVTGGQHAGSNGGGVRVRGNVEVAIVESVIEGNHALNGGGVSVEGTPEGTPALILVGNADTLAIVGNEASGDGGGLYCRDAGVYCDRSCLIARNAAGGNGGGIAQQGCGISLYPSVGTIHADAESGLIANEAAGNGGGAWVSGGYFALSSGEPGRPAKVAGNSAGGDGGGVYFTALVDGSNTQRGVQFDDNHAGGEGGAIYADSGFLIMHPAIGVTCGANADWCMRFLRNHADTGAGAIALRGTASALLMDLLFVENAAPAASAITLGSGNLTMQNVLASGQSSATELIHSAGGNVDLRYVTIAGNGDDDSALLRYAVPATLSIRNSILHDVASAAPGLVVDAPPGMNFMVDCVLVHEDSALAGQPGVGNLVVADPQWDDAGNWPAYLRVPGMQSPAVDACGSGPGVIPDLLGTERPQDLPKPDGAGPFDMGAIERGPDTIFGDGFESSSP